MQKRFSLLRNGFIVGALLLGGTTVFSSLAQATDYGYQFLRRGTTYQDRFVGQAWWRPEVVGGASHIKIVLSEQKAYCYKGGRLAGVTPVSTGMAGYRTPIGSFRVTEKKFNHRSNLYGHYVARSGYVLRSNVDVRRHRRPPGSIFRGASMDYMMRFNGAVTMHAGYVPGYPASHGCVRLPWHMAKIFFSNATVGTKVSVVP